MNIKTKVYIKLMFYPLLALAITYILFFTCACSKNNDEIANNSNQYIKILGVSEFGLIQIGNSAETKLLFYNNTSFSRSISSISDRYTRKITYDDKCIWPVVPANYTCTYTIRYSPQENIPFNLSYAFNGESVLIKSKSVFPSKLVLNDPTQSNINIGSIEAGTSFVVDIKINNSGEMPANFVLKNGATQSYLSASSIDCDGLINPGGSCLIRLKIIPQVSGLISDYLSIISENNIINVKISGIINPSSPYGDVSIQKENSAESSDELIATSTTESIIYSSVIKDVYGNVVSDNTEFSIFFNNLFVSDVNGNLIKSGAKIKTASGIFRLKVRCISPSSSGVANSEVKLINTPSFGYKSFICK